MAFDSVRSIFRTPDFLPLLSASAFFPRSAEKTPPASSTNFLGVFMRHFILSTLLPVAAFAQSGPEAGAHEVPFASAGNVIELAIENTSSIPQSPVTVSAATLPAWLMLEPRESALGDLPGRTEKTARFTFAVDRTAPVNSDYTVVFTVSGNQGQAWSKTVSIRIAPPESFELFQNYPNPFNPTTSIAYQLPHESRVRLVIYDLLGKEVSTLVNGHRSAGYHQETWDASGAASGLYVYRMTARSEEGKEWVQTRAMMVLR